VVAENLIDENQAFAPKRSDVEIIDNLTSEVLEELTEEVAEIAQEIVDEASEDLLDHRALDHLSQLTQEEPATLEKTPEEAKPSPYETLHISTEDRQKIGAILVTMAENNVFKLLFEKKRLERLGYEVNHVHPIRFLGTVFSDPRLVHCLRKIRTSGFKWDGFIDGFSQRFKQEVKAGNIDKYIPSFAASLGVNPEDVQAYVNYRDYEGLVLFLLEKKR